MVTVNLEGYRVNKLNYVYDEKSGEKNIEVATTMKTNVRRIAKGKGFCFCSFSMQPTDIDGKFNVEVEVVGAITFDDDSDKKEVHVEAARILYPYLQATVSSLMSTIGLSNYVLPDFSITATDVLDD